MDNKGEAVFTFLLIVSLMFGGFAKYYNDQQKEVIEELKEKCEVVE